MWQKAEKNILWFGMFMTVTMESAAFMGKKYLNNSQSFLNTTDLTLEQMFDISYEILVWTKWGPRIGNNSLGKSFMEISVIYWWWRGPPSSSHKGLRLFGFCVVPWADFRNPESNDAWEQRLGWIKYSHNYRNFDRIDGEPMEFEWHIFPGFNTLQLSQEVKELLLTLNETPENFTGRIFLMSKFNDVSWRSRDNKVQRESNANLVSLFAWKFGAGQWSFLGLGSEKKWYSISEDSPQGDWDNIAEKCWWNSLTADVLFSALWLHCPEVN